MGQPATKGPAPHQARKQPAPFKTGAWEWFTTGYFDEKPEDNGITVTDTGVSSWVGKIQGIDYAQSVTGQRPNFVNEQERGFKCPAVYFDATNQEFMNYDAGSDLNFMHDGTGGSVFMICATDIGSTITLWTNGGTTSPTHIGALLQTLSTNAFRSVVVNGSAYVTLQSDTTANKPDPRQSMGIGWSYSTADGISTFYDGHEFTNTAESASPSVSDPSYVSSLGKQGNSSGYITGYITDLIIWDKVISDAERDEVLAWSKHRIKE